MSIALKILDAVAPSWAWSRRLKADPWLRQMFIFMNWRLFDPNKAADDESIAALQRQDLAVRNQMAEVLLRRIREVADSADRRIAARRWFVDEARSYARIFSIFVDEDGYEVEVSAGARHPMNFGLLSSSQQIVSEAVPDLVKEKGSVGGAVQSLVEESHWLYTRLYLARVAVTDLEEDGTEAASWMSEYVRLLVVKSELDLRVAVGLPMAADLGLWSDAVDEIDRRILGGERDPIASASISLMQAKEGEGAMNEYEEQARAELVSLAEAMLAGHESFLEGAVKVLDLRNRIGGIGDHDPDFSAFVLISSETDNLPLAQFRHLWSQAENKGSWNKGSGL